MARPRLEPGHHGAIRVTKVDPIPAPSSSEKDEEKEEEAPPALAPFFVARTQLRGLDGVSRQVEARGRSTAAAKRALIHERIPKVLAKQSAFRGTTTINTETRVSALAEFWLEEISESGALAAGTLDFYRRGTAALIAPELGGNRVADLTVPTLDGFIKTLVASKSPSSGARAKKILSLMCGLAVRHGALPANPVRELPKITQPKKDVRALSLDDLAALRDAVRVWESRPRSGPPRRNRLSDTVDIFLATGGRIGEVLALRWQDIDFEASPPTVTICGTLIAGPPISRQPFPKTASGHRTLALPNFAVEVLMRKRLESPANNPYGAVFVTRKGTWLAPNNVRRDWRAVRENAGFDWVAPHTFRRTVATLIDAENGSRDAAAQLGHSSDAVTRQHYIQKAAQVPDFTTILDKFGDG